MRQIFQGQAVAEGATASTDTLNSESWRLFDGILRCNNTGAASATVSVIVKVTGEQVEPTIVAPGGKSSNTFKIPGQYTVQIDTVGVGGAILDVWIDGDTGNA